MIFMNFLSRSSRATGPKMRVPRISPASVQQHHRVVVEADVAAVLAARLLAGAHHHCLAYGALLGTTVGQAFLMDTTTVSPMRA
jgi:hypothetical protein